MVPSMGGFIELNGATSPPRVRSILIVGGGAAAWLAAATLARLLKPGFCTIGVVCPVRHAEQPFSEVVLPSFHRLNALLGIDEQDLLRRTDATFRLGARFSDWGRLGARYFHTSGPIGAKLDGVPFHQHWLRLREADLCAGIEDYSIATVAAKRGRFAPPVADGGSVLSLYSYGYHFDAVPLADTLRQYACAHGVARVRQSLAQVEFRVEDGSIEALRLDDGSSVSADFYIDCRAGESLLSRPGAAARYEDWSRWLPCDRWVGVRCEQSGEIAPYADVIAQPTGWAQRIPLRRSVDCGQAYSSEWLDDDAALTALMRTLPGQALSAPRRWQLAAGRPTHFWDKNCLQLATPGLDPLEATSLHLVQTGITRFLTLFPARPTNQEEREEYNRLTNIEYERIRDFLILHYKATTRDDSPFWAHCRQLEIPDTLRTKIELFQRCGRIAMRDDEHFGEDSWLTVFLGQGIHPRAYDPLAEGVDPGRARDALAHLRSLIDAGASTLPMVGQFLDQYCPTQRPGRA
jgi:tryptophan 7-halogenase